MASPSPSPAGRCGPTASSSSSTPSSTAASDAGESTDRGSFVVDPGHRSTASSNRHHRRRRLKLPPEPAYENLEFHRVKICVPTNTNNSVSSTMNVSSADLKPGGRVLLLGRPPGVAAGDARIVRGGRLGRVR